MNKNVNSHVCIPEKMCKLYQNRGTWSITGILDFEIESFFISVCTIEVCVIYWKVWGGLS